MAFVQSSVPSSFSEAVALVAEERRKRSVPWLRLLHAVLLETFPSAASAPGSSAGVFIHTHTPLEDQPLAADIPLCLTSARWASADGGLGSVPTCDAQLVVSVERHTPGGRAAMLELPARIHALVDRLQNHPELAAAFSLVEAERLDPALCCDGSGRAALSIVRLQSGMCDIDLITHCSGTGGAADMNMATGLGTPLGSELFECCVYMKEWARLTGGIGSWYVEGAVKQELAALRGEGGLLAPRDPNWQTQQDPLPAFPGVLTGRCAHAPLCQAEVSLLLLLRTVQRLSSAFGRGGQLSSGLVAKFNELNRLGATTSSDGFIALIDPSVSPQLAAQRMVNFQQQRLVQSQQSVTAFGAPVGTAEDDAMMSLVQGWSLR